MDYTVKEQEPLISVIIDTYNYGCFIEDAIKSVLTQTLSKDLYEIIIVDDGSLDDTRERVEKYIPRVTYLYKENGGQASAFNAGLEAANGEFVAFLDADDYWQPEKLEYVLAAFQESVEVDVVYHAQCLTDAAGNDLGGYPADLLNQNPAENFWQGKSPIINSTSAISFRTSVLRKILPVPIELKICADVYLMAAIPLVSSRFALLGKQLGNYRLHGNNMWAHGYLVDRSMASVVSLIETQELSYSYVDKLSKRLGIDCCKQLRLLRLNDLLDQALYLKRIYGIWSAIGLIIRYRERIYKIDANYKALNLVKKLLILALPVALFNIIYPCYKAIKRKFAVQKLANNGCGI